MGSHDPDVAEQKRLRARALEIGNTLDAGAEDELRHLLECRLEALLEEKLSRYIQL